MSDIYFTPASDNHKKREKEKARLLRQGLWWKQVLGKKICYHCEHKFKAEELTMDHLIPIARGGKSDKKNCGNTFSHPTFRFNTYCLFSFGLGVFIIFDKTSCIKL